MTENLAGSFIPSGWFYRSYKLRMRQEDYLPWRQGDEKARLIVDLYDLMIKSWGIEEAEIFDLTAAVLMVQSDLCDFEPLHLEVTTEDGPALGQTRVVPDTPPNLRACLEPDAEQIKQHLVEIFSP
jgi:inosine-uridine nucleoside N-ribohydrolase